MAPEKTLIRFHDLPATSRGAVGSHGFTLIELMIVVVVIGILASIAFPSYRDYAQRARRADAMALLADIQARQERYFFDHQQYAAALTDLGFGSGSAVSPQGFYQATLEVLSSGTGAGAVVTGYTASAAAAPNNTAADECGALTLDARGNKGASGLGTPPAADADDATRADYQTRLAKCWR